MTKRLAFHCYATFSCNGCGFSSDVIVAKNSFECDYSRNKSIFILHPNCVKDCKMYTCRHRDDNKLMFFAQKTLP